jgi:hypothetical protein
MEHHVHAGARSSDHFRVSHVACDHLHAEDPQLRILVATEHADGIASPGEHFDYVAAQKAAPASH